MLEADLRCVIEGCELMLSATEQRSSDAFEDVRQMVREVRDAHIDLLKG